MVGSFKRNCRTHDLAKRKNGIWPVIPTITIKNAQKCPCLREGCECNWTPSHPFHAGLILGNVCSCDRYKIPTIRKVSDESASHQLSVMVKVSPFELEFEYKPRRHFDWRERTAASPTPREQQLTRAQQFARRAHDAVVWARANLFRAQQRRRSRPTKKGVSPTSLQVTTCTSPGRVGQRTGPA